MVYNRLCPPLYLIKDGHGDHTTNAAIHAGNETTEQGNASDHRPAARTRAVDRRQLLHERPPTVHGQMEGRQRNDGREDDRDVIDGNAGKRPGCTYEHEPTPTQLHGI